MSAGNGDTHASTEDTVWSADDVIEIELLGSSILVTGADEDRSGLLELASGGTLFLDEVGDMPLALQAKLLRVLQEKQARRLGDQRTRPVDIRLVTATHKDLRATIDSGAFREDLYYRLAVLQIRVPPLRERDGDVTLLAKLFLERFNREFGQQLEGFAPSALEALERYGRASRSLVQGTESWKQQVERPISPSAAGLEGLTETERGLVTRWIEAELYEELERAAAGKSNRSSPERGADLVS